MLAVIRGSAVNQDGRSSGLTVPNGPAQEAVIRQALAQRGGAAWRCRLRGSARHGHLAGRSDRGACAGGGVRGGAGAGGKPLVVGSVKTNIGHLEAAAGVAGLIKVVLSLQQGQYSGAPALPEDESAHRLEGDARWRSRWQGKEWKGGGKRRIAGVSSFGFSGTNAHVVVEEAPAAERRAGSAPVRQVQVLTMSARSETALAELAAELCGSGWRSGDADLGGRLLHGEYGAGAFRERAVYIGGSREELAGEAGEGTPWRSRAGQRDGPRVGVSVHRAGGAVCGHGAGVI